MTSNTISSDWSLGTELLQEMRVQTMIITLDDAKNNEYVFDLGLRRLFNAEFNYKSALLSILQNYSDNTITRYRDVFRVRWFILKLPDQSDSFMIVGPYTLTQYSPEYLMNQVGGYPEDTHIANKLKIFCQNIPYIANEDLMFMIICLMGKRIYQGDENYTLRTATLDDINLLSPSEYEFLNFSYNSNSKNDIHEASQAKKKTSDDSSVKSISDEMDALEDRYKIEDSLLYFIEHGQHNKALKEFETFSSYNFEKRVSDTLRNSKNYAIIMNTLLRKAAQRGGVHPYYINEISSDYARKIETMSNISDLNRLQKEMITGYTLLVNRNSTSQYSLPVQKIILMIDSDLTAPLTLQYFSSVLSMNKTYLSTLFKTETKISLTDYVNKKRADYAAILLNTTSLEIQSIAAATGFIDSNYFSKCFKKVYGKTPTDYRHRLNK